MKQLRKNSTVLKLPLVDADGICAVTIETYVRGGLRHCAQARFVSSAVVTPSNGVLYAGHPRTLHGMIAIQTNEVLATSSKRYIDSKSYAS